MNLPKAMAKDGVNMLFGEKTTLTQGALQEVKLAAGVTLAEQIDANYIRSNKQYILHLLQAKDEKRKYIRNAQLSKENLEKQIRKTSSEIKDWEGLDSLLVNAQGELNKILKDPEGYIKANMPTSRDDSYDYCAGADRSINGYTPSSWEVDWRVRNTGMTHCLVWERKTVITPINQTAAEKAAWYNYQVNSLKERISGLKNQIAVRDRNFKQVKSSLSNNHYQVNQFNMGMKKAHNDLENIQNQLDNVCKKALKGKSEVSFTSSDVQRGRTYQKYLTLKASNPDCASYILEYVH